MLFALLSVAFADLPLLTYPDCGREESLSDCPEDLNDWEQLSFIEPDQQANIRPAELELGSGNHLDRAVRLHTGRFDVRVGIMDSGIEWSHSDLKRKFYLHAPELPLPQLANGEETGEYDVNGDGLFNIDDYQDDPRVDITAGHDWGDDTLDPSDLIALFADGVDDDGNGYVDDISGWDFFERDNDAFHTHYDGFGSHGNGVAREAAAEGGNGGNIGNCPNCSIVPLRVGDTFITDGGRCAEAIAYAADMNVTAVTMAVGALSNSDSTVAAARYAWDMGTLLVGAAGDENGYHHNFPAVLDDVIYAHSITYNSRNNPASYMNTWNCNNFGARMTMVAASSACATGSVAVITGAAGLIKSAGLDAGYDLHPGEITQLLTQHTTDVWLTEEERARTKSYSSQEGWDPFYGYGRLNLGDSVAAVQDGEIPPVVSIRGVEWFEVIDPKQQSTLEIEAILRTRTDSLEWVLEYGLGNDPRTWTNVDTGTLDADFDGVLASLDITSLPTPSPIPEAMISETIEQRLERVNQPAVTLRLRATDASGVQGEMRKTFYVQPDPDLKPGFPFKLEGSGEASPIMVDLNNDGVMEVIVADGSGRVYAIQGDGQMLEGFPVQTDLREGAQNSPAFQEIPTLHDVIIATPAAGDLDGDGDIEIVAAGIYGGVYAWHHDGTPVSGYPTSIIERGPSELTNEFVYDNGFVGAPALYDLDDNGTLEVIIAGMDSRLYVFDSQGGDWGPYPIEMCAEELCGVSGVRTITSPAIGDVDNDGSIEIGIATNEAVDNGSKSVSYLLDAASGEVKSGWPAAVSGLVGEAVLLPLIGEGHPASLAFADLDNDGDMEIANAVMLGNNPPIHHDTTDALQMSFLGTDFSTNTNANIPSLVQMVANPVFGDLDQDGVPEYITGAVSSVYLASLAARSVIEYQQGVGAWSGTTGEMLSGWPRQIEDVQFLAAPGIADVSGDGAPEVLMVSAGYLMHAWDALGNEAEGYPKFTGNWILGSPALGDVDGDGYLDVAVTTREGWLFVWGTQGRADQAIEWASIHHDAQNTGNYHHPIPTQAGPMDELTETECGCGNSKSALILLPLVIGWGRRRRR